jgi:hypothetical protein
MRFRRNNSQLAVILLCIICSGCETPTDRKRLEVLRQMAAETPPPIGFVELSRGDLAKSTGAIVSISYRSSLPFDEVKAFYVKALEGKGWGAPEDKVQRYWTGPNRRDLTFHKGEYSIKISRDDNSQKYNVNFLWEPK